MCEPRHWRYGLPRTPPGTGVCLFIIKCLWKNSKSSCRHYTMLFFLIQKHHSLWRITFNCSHNRMWYIKLLQIYHISFCQFDPKRISCLIQILYFCSSNDWRRYSLRPLPCQCNLRHFTLIFFCKCRYTFHDFYFKKLMPSSSACFSKTHTSHA